MKKSLFMIVLCVICGMMSVGCGAFGQKYEKEEGGVTLQHKAGSKVPDAFLDDSQKAVRVQNIEYDENNMDYRLVWSDEFDYEGRPDENKWSYGSGDNSWGDEELQYYTEDNVKVEDGKLFIELRKEQVEGYDYSSGRMVTRGKGDWTYGKIEVSAKLPKNQGIQPAIWMMSSDSEYGERPYPGELDISGPAGEHSDAFHVYAVEWLPDKLVYTIDGEEYLTYNLSELMEDPAYADWPYNKNMYLILNIAFGGNQGGQYEIDENLESACMEVEYVRVYQSPYICYIERTDEEVGNPLLKADGKVLRNEAGQGDIVQLKGTNAGGYLFQELWMTTTVDTNSIKAEEDIYAILTERFGKDQAMELISIYQENCWTEEDFDFCKQIGMNCIRLPFWYRNLVDENGEFYEDCWERLDWFIEQAAARELYVILDFHGAPGSQNGSDHSGKDGGNEKLIASEFFFGEQETVEKNQELFYRIWEAIAEHYKDNPWVAGYDLINEPYCSYRHSSGYAVSDLHKMLWDVYDMAYQRIRAIDPEHIIIMEAVWEPTDLPDPDDYGWENVMYQYHHYPSNDYKNAAAIDMKEKVNAIVRADYNVPSYLGEFTLYDDLETWDKGLDVINKSGISWTNWTYKVAFQGNWGIRNQRNQNVNLETYNYEAIAGAWSQVDASNENMGLSKVLSKYYKMVYLGAE